ncbi:MAG: hypothetical protein HETSPECPRED_002358 [Heterodermia speciosa]|uniref:Uncharacterized protein n=1 Tax=Heterodermia speciosa TaxID=116794 RepID=A0A8H3I554_9LECA|nr:MAG: hypothetical protein HETSPECPRED_002358 [Heterodermia speciosa]
MEADNECLTYSLAILGEAAVAQTARTSCLTYAGFLPRLLPAPQALLRISRPDRLSTFPADVIGYHSGNLRHTLGLIPTLLLKPELLNRFHVQCLRIERASKSQEAVVTAATFGPLTLLAIASFLLFVGLVVFAIYLGDGMALLALALLGSVSIIAHIGLYHRIDLAEYKDKNRSLPKSDVVIVYPNGSFQIVSCNEEIARKLFIEPEKCVYKIRSADLYRALAMLATLMLMFGVICLANAAPRLQFAFACVLVALNAAHWIVAALPEHRHWDLRTFDVKPTERWATERYSQALWTLIASTGTTRWVKSAKIAPDNQAWDAWLNEAQDHLVPGKIPVFKNKIMVEPLWDCQAALSRLLSEYEILDDTPSLHPPRTNIQDEKPTGEAKSDEPESVKEKPLI